MFILTFLLGYLVGRAHAAVKWQRFHTVWRRRDEP